MKTLVLILLLTWIIPIDAQVRDQTLSGPYIGQKQPGTIPEIFAPDFVSTTANGELNAVFSKNGNEFYFSQRGPGKLSTIMVTRQVEGMWTNPEPVSFSGINDDIDLFITEDGKSMVFCSYELKPGYPDHDFRISYRKADQWSSPVPYAIEAISKYEDYYPVVTGKGNLYFNSQRGGAGTNDIYVSNLINGKYTSPRKLPEPINTEYREFDAFVTHDESFMIFSSERPGGYGKSDLYLSLKKKDGTWSAPVNLGKSINSAYQEYAATITPDGKFLFFTSTRNGSEDIFWISAKILEELRPKE